MREKCVRNGQVKTVSKLQYLVGDRVYGAKLSPAVQDLSGLGKLGSKALAVATPRCVELYHEAI